jgi:oligopeptidase B
MEAGHGGASGRFDRLEEVALIYAFALEAAEGFRSSKPRPAGRREQTP